MAPSRKDRSAAEGKPLTVDEFLALRAQCDRFISGYRLRTPQHVVDEFALLGDDLQMDGYGAGGTVEILENEVRNLLNKPAAVFMPSGTMIQMSALRIHADKRKRNVVAFHPTCHLELHEDKAYQRLHGLIGLKVGDPDDLITIKDLEAIHEPIAALLLELPQREIGGLLPAWDDLVAQVKWAHDCGAATHMDGARLWESAPFYGKSYAQLAALFDTVYVSFYKGLMGTAGGMLLGEEDVIAEAREWRHRHGGTLYNLWPYAASALIGLRTKLPKIAKHAKQARKIAAALTSIDGILIKPDPPQTPMMHIYLRTTPETFNAAVRRLAREEHLWTFGGSAPAQIPGYRRVEFYCGEATMELKPEVIADAFRALLGQ